MAFSLNDPLGADLSLFPDLDPAGALVSGTTCLMQALMRRFTTPRGGLFYDPGYGTDLRSLLGEALTSGDGSSVGTDIEQEALQEERVLLAQATVTVNLATSKLAVKLDIQSSSGPFTMVLAVSAVTVTLLKAG